MGKIRLDKYVSETSEHTRSQVKQLLRRGAVTVNDAVQRDGAYKVDPECEVVRLEGETLVPSSFVYLMLHKPKGVVTARSDQWNETVFSLLGKDVGRRGELSAVGRLDKDTTGLLLFTDDGELNHRLTSPRRHAEKTYQAVLNEPLEDLERSRQHFLEGLDIGDEKPTLPAVLEELEEDRAYQVTVTEGRFHQIKRMFQAEGRRVVELKRIAFGGITLDPELSEGEYRALTQEEIRRLKGNGAEGVTYGK